MEEEILRKIFDSLARLETKVQNLEKIGEKVDKMQVESVKTNEEVQSVRNTVSELVDKNKWLSRSIAGGFITFGFGLFATIIKINM